MEPGLTALQRAHSSSLAEVDAQVFISQDFAQERAST